MAALNAIAAGNGNDAIAPAAVAGPYRVNRGKGVRCKRESARRWGLMITNQCARGLASAAPRVTTAHEGEDG